MKTKYLIGLGAIALAGLFTFNNHADPQSRHDDPQVVVITTLDTRTPTPGLYVLNVSSSDGAPVIGSYYSNQWIPVAQALAILKKERFRITYVSANGGNFILERP